MLITITDAAKQAGVHYSTICKAMDRGALPFVTRPPDNRRFVHREAVEIWRQTEQRGRPKGPEKPVRPRGRPRKEVVLEQMIRNAARSQIRSKKKSKETEETKEKVAA